MAWIERWRAIAARIEGRLCSGQYVVGARGEMTAIPLELSDIGSLPARRRITSELRAFRDASQAELPRAAVEV